MVHNQMPEMFHLMNVELGRLESLYLGKAITSTARNLKLTKSGKNTDKKSSFPAPKIAKIYQL